MREKKKANFLAKKYFSEAKKLDWSKRRVLQFIRKGSSQFYEI